MSRVLYFLGLVVMIGTTFLDETEQARGFAGAACLIGMACYNRIQNTKPPSDHDRA